MGYTFTKQIINEDGTIEESSYDVPYWSLSPEQATIVLLICKGILTLQEGVNITNLPEGHLINEAEAWAIAAERLP